ncbi:tRNA 2-selenouridine synthase [Melghiribacillus thermohalophilus]|uniref:tRNA 2-selenouridine synthase n=1 Tax=Melghiribacillus thermohalophilus TaxID=1324956 RepID=A0A4R3NGA8_9BACI|nr:tRNA 2-selenouridine(34) synthase MnmH [Melghiribacillus thermohalophilus]TCT26303.1 tRNA 2-selenouridine synthase [Melghiribacillus thermohalophilus]
MYQDIEVDELFSGKEKETVTMIDVRSPSEFQEGRIPGSINIPVFDDQERAEVGTIYKQDSPEAARERGVEIFSEKLPAFLKAFQAIDGQKVVYCWRGGMRSKAAATVVDLMGMTIHRLKGGYRAYRKWVVHTLDELNLTPAFFVLNGNTGTGKTAILHRLKEEGYPVIDLEGMANHRGSIFGHIGQEPHNQKTFDSLLVHDLLTYQDSPFIVIEGESKRIGKVVLPSFLIEKKEQGMQLFIELPVEERVKNILDDYQPWNREEAYLQAYERIKRRIHTPVAKDIEANLKAGKFEQAIEQLLAYYYDPRYQHAAAQYEEGQKIVIKARDVDDAVHQVKQVLPAYHPNLRGKRL